MQTYLYLSLIAANNESEFQAWMAILPVKVRGPGLDHRSDPDGDNAAC